MSDYQPRRRDRIIAAVLFVIIIASGTRLGA